MNSHWMAKKPLSFDELSTHFGDPQGTSLEQARAEAKVALEFMKQPDLKAKLGQIFKRPAPKSCNNEWMRKRLHQVCGITVPIKETSSKGKKIARNAGKKPLKSLKKTKNDKSSPEEAPNAVGTDAPDHAMHGVGLLTAELDALAIHTDTNMDQPWGADPLTADLAIAMMNNPVRSNAEVQDLPNWFWEDFPEAPAGRLDDAPWQ